MAMYFGEVLERGGKRLVLTLSLPRGDFLIVTHAQKCFNINKI